VTKKGNAQHLYSALIKVRIHLGVMNHKMLFVSMEHVQKMLDAMENISVDMEKMSTGAH
jgi:hypothetical protein